MSDLRNHVEMIAKFQEQNCKSQLNPARFLADHGRDYEFGPDSFAGEKGEPHNCFGNALDRATENPELTYVEGYIDCCGVPIEHAWLVGEDNRVIEPTIKGDGSHIGGYFGVPVKTAYAIKSTFRAERYGVFSGDYEFRWLHDNPKDIIRELELEAA